MAKPGFSFKVNPLFLLVVFLFVILGMGREVLVAFSLVVLHELMHVFTAWRVGYKVLRIELFPFGGVAEYRGLLEMEPWQEIKIALAGPMFNLFLAGLFYILFNSKWNLIPGNYVKLLIKYNLMLGFFNLLPALPLDGGRVLRGLLVSNRGFRRGSNTAIRFARTLAVIGAILGIFAVIFNQSNIWILFVSFFVYGAAIKEEEHVLYSLLSYLTHRKDYVNDISIKPVNSQVVRGNIFLKEVITYLIPDKYNIFYVLDKKSMITGSVTEIQLLDSFLNLEEKDVEVMELVKRE